MHGGGTYSEPRAVEASHGNSLPRSRVRLSARSLVPLPANRDLKSYAAAAKGLESSLWHLAITFATDFVVQLNGCAVSFHSSMKAISRSASFSLLGKSTILSRFLLRMLNHCSTWFIHEQWTGG